MILLVLYLLFTFLALLFSVALIAYETYRGYPIVLEDILLLLAACLIPVLQIIVLGACVACFAKEFIRPFLSRMDDVINNKIQELRKK